MKKLTSNQLETLSKKAVELYQFIFDNYKSKGYLRNQLPSNLRIACKELKDNNIVVYKANDRIQLSESYMKSEWIKEIKKEDKAFHDFMRNRK